MTIGQHDRSEPGKVSRAASHRPQTLADHRAFAPLLGLWGAALAGLSILVLPSSLVTSAAKGTGLVLLGALLQAVLAALAALLLGGLMYLLASRWRREKRRHAHAPSIVTMAGHHVRALDPQRDLGSTSFDAPIVSKQPVPPAPPIADTPPPRALDLGEFAELPNRNAVWVEDGPETQSETPTAAPAEVPIAPVVLRSVSKPAHPGTAALARLRATPPHELSLAEMVERFAGALHEHREIAPGKVPGGRDLAAREAALAEALKALASLSGRPAKTADLSQEDPLRDALTRLQGLRGAA